MKNSFKMVLLASIGLASVSAAQAGDLIVGVYQSGLANTTALDLGVTDAALLTGGETWDLSGALSAASMTLNTTAMFGVVGDISNGTTAASKSVFVTTSGFAPNNINGKSAFLAIDGGYGSIGLGTQVSGSGSDWTTESDPTSSSGGVATELGFSPSGSAAGVIDLWTVVANNTSPVLDGTFTLNTSSDVLTFNAVPEPATCSLLAGAGLLVVALRNKLGRKQA